MVIARDLATRFAKCGLGYDVLKKNDILADLQVLLREHGVTGRWNGTDMLVHTSST